jgi:hypothetical protein
MQLSTETVAPYIGGQIEVQSRGEGYLYRGKVATAIVEDNTLRITLEWMAKAIGYPNPPSSWENDENLKYGASLEIYGVSELGGGRIVLSGIYTDEIAVLFPTTEEGLDPSKVVGLDLSNVA